MNEFTPSNTLAWQARNANRSQKLETLPESLSEARDAPAGGGEADLDGCATTPPCSDSEGANASGIFGLQLPLGAEAQYKLDATGTNIWIRTRIKRSVCPLGIRPRSRRLALSAKVYMSLENEPA